MSFWLRDRELSQARRWVLVVTAIAAAIAAALLFGSATSRAACLPTGPANTSLPTLSPTGNQPISTALTLTEGSWSPTCGIYITSYSYAWFRDGTQFASGTFPSGQTSTTYTTASADIGHTITAQVTVCDTNTDCNPASPTGSVYVPPAPSGSTSVSGTMAVGNTLSGSWSGSSLLPITSTSYQWSRCSYGTAILNDGPADWWRLGDSALSQRGARDEQLTADGSYTSSGVTYGVTGALQNDPDTAVTLDGSTGYVSLPSGIQFDSGNFSVEGWFKTSSSANQQIWSSGSSGGNQHVSLWMTAGKLEFQAEDSAGTTVTLAPTQTYNNGAWHYVAVTRNANTYTLWVDGGQIKAATQSSPALGDLDATGASTQVGDGTYSPNSGYFFNGSLDEVAVYHTALSATQLQNHHNAGTNFTRGCVSISGATSANYTLTAADYDTELNLKLTKCNADGCGTNTSPFIAWTAAANLGQRREYTDVQQQLTDQESLSVNVANGNLTLAADDLSLPGIAGFKLDYPRYYNSEFSARDNAPVDQLAPGWETLPTLNVLWGGDVRYTGQSGYEVTFALNGSNYISPPGVDATLVKQGDGTFVLTFDQAGNQQLFSTTGVLTAYKDRNGNTVSFNRSGGQLSSITDTTGRTTTLTYNGSGQLTMITAPGICNSQTSTCTYSYGYDGSGNLTSFTDPTGAVTGYAYTGGLLTKVTDPDLNATKISYDASNRVASVQSGLNSSGTCPTGATCPLTTFNYAVAGGTFCGTPTTDVTVPNQQPSGTPTRYCFDSQLRVTATKAPTGDVTSTDYTTAHGGSNCTDGNGNSLDDRPCSTTSGRGYITTYGYDSTGRNLVWEQNPVQTSTHRSSWAYGDSSHPYQPTSFTDANLHTTNYSYTATGDLAVKTDPLGNATSYCYDASGELTYEFAPLAGTVNCASPPANYRTSYTYYTTNGAQGTIGDLASVTDPVGNETTYTYDAAGNQTSKVDPLGNVSGGTPANYTISHTYDADGRTLTETNERGYTTTYIYDSAGNLSTTTDANSHVTSDCYNANNELVSEFDALAGQVNCASPPSSNGTLYTYDADGNKLTATDQLGHTTSYCYDSANRLIYEFSPLAGAVNCASPPSSYRTSYGYDADGNQLTVVSTMSSTQSTTTTSTYYPDDSLETVTDGAGNKKTYTYDYVGNQTTELDSASGQTSTETQTGYSANNQVSSVTSGLNSSGQCPIGAPTLVCPKTTYTYDANGNLLTEVSPDDQTSGVPTTYCYDQANERIYEFSPLAGTVNCASPPTNYTIAYNYDANGDLHSKQTPMGTITYGYDYAGEVTSKAYQNAADNTNPATPNVSYAYDPVGNRVAMTDGGGTVSFAYDPLNQLCAVIRGGTANCTTPATGTFTYAYNAAGFITNRTYPDGTSVIDTPDANGNLASVASGGATTSYTYNQDGTLATTTLPAMGGYTFIGTKTYDNAEHLTNDTTTKNGSVLAGFQYTPDQFGSPLAVSRTGSLTCTTTNTYDNNERLATATYGGSNCPTNNSDANAFTYTYDADGNITEAAGATTTYYAYNAADETCNSSSSPNPTCANPQYIYDGNGNEAYDPSTGRSYTYDLENRMISQTSGTQTTTYTYDGDGNMLTACPANSPTIDYTWDTKTDDGVPRLILETGGSTNRYIYGNGLVSDYNGTVGQTQYYVSDGLGSTVSTIASGNPNTGWTYTYEPYGSQRYAQNSGSQPNEVQFTGGRVDPAINDSSLYDTPTRAYDAATGRFTSRDSGEAAASYIYANDNPVTRGNLTGESPLAFIGGGYSDPGPTIGCAGNIRTSNSGINFTLKWCWDVQDRLTDVEKSYSQDFYWDGFTKSGTTLTAANGDKYNSGAWLGSHKTTFKVTAAWNSLASNAANAVTEKFCDSGGICVKLPNIFQIDVFVRLVAGNRTPDVWNKFVQTF